MALNVEIINHNHPNTFNSMSNWCLAPYRYLFQGRTVEIVNGNINQENASFPVKSYMKTAAAITTLVPSLIFGLIFRFFASLSSQVKNDQILAANYLSIKSKLVNATGSVLPVPPQELSYLQAYNEFMQSQTSLKNQIQGDKDIWKNPSFIAEIDQVMSKGLVFMQIYFRELASAANYDAKKMRERMEIQPQNRRSDDPCQIDFCHPFFDFFRFYYQVRGCWIRSDSTPEEIDYGYEQTYLNPIPLTPDLQDCYFDPTKVQYQWRTQLNAICKLMQELGLRINDSSRTANQDPRFDSWSHLDESPVRLMDYPDSAPT